MIKTDLPIYLASKSPRRKKLLEQVGLKFKIIALECDENIDSKQSPVKNVKRIAEEKMICARKKVNTGIIITADTIVVLDSKIIGKPKDQKDAFRILKKLSRRTHFVYTGISILNCDSDKWITTYEKTAVKFRKISDDEIIDYIKSGSPMDKAGAYGIQDDYGAVFVEKIIGCYYNVVGLPLANLYQSLLKVI